MSQEYETSEACIYNCKPDPIKTPVYIVTDWVGVYLYRKDYSPRNLQILVPSILLGVGIATVITPYTPESALLVFTGAIGLWHCARSWLKLLRFLTKAWKSWAGP